MAVAGDEDDRSVGECRDALHQLDAVGPGQDQVEQDQVGLLRLDDVRQLRVVARDQRGIARRGERVADVAQRLRVVVHHEDAHRFAVVPRRLRPGRGGGTAGLLGHREGKGDARAQADPAALGVDAPAMGFHEPLADGEAQPARAAARVVVGVFAEQRREPLRRHALPLVGNRDRDVHPVADRRDPDRGRLGRVPGRVGEQVVQDLHEALPVGHHPGQVRRQVEEDAVPATAGQEGVPRLVHQRGHVRGLGGHRQRARVDAPGIEQVADEAAHVIGLIRR